MDPVCVTAEGDVVPNPRRAVEGGRTARYSDGSQTGIGRFASAHAGFQSFGYGAYL
jgi:hypothetical protein